MEGNDKIIEDFKGYIEEKTFVCIAAKAALAKNQVKSLVVNHMACPFEDHFILQFLYSFIDGYRTAKNMYHSAAIIFKQPDELNEELFDQLLWQRLQALSQLDAQNYPYDKRVDCNPASADFSFSLKEEAFFVIGMHAQSSRESRQFKYPTLVFNPHVQFEQLRSTGKYEHLKLAVRKKDVQYSGSINPMLQDFGNASEVYQYSGRPYDKQWQCPLKVNHAQS